MNPEQLREKIKVLRRKENIAGAIGLVGAAEAVGSLLLTAFKTGDERAMALATLAAFIPAIGGAALDSRYSGKKQELLREEALSRLLEGGKRLVQTVRELPQETFDKLWVGFQGIRDELRDSQLEIEPFDFVYQAFADRAKGEGSEDGPR